MTWKWQDPDVKLPFIASPALAGNYVVTGNHDKQVYCFDKNNGKKAWAFNSGSRIEASPVIAGKSVLAANMRGDLFLLNLSDGKKSGIMSWDPRWSAIRLSQETASCWEQATASFTASAREQSGIRNMN